MSAGRRPVIGVAAALERARWSVWDQEAVLVPRSYVDRVHEAGGLAWIIAPDGKLVDEVDEVVARLDGLILIGGADIDPSAYGAAPHPATTGTVPERDAWELALTRAAWQHDLPFLGICRGMQLMNVAAGGTLNQHLPDDLGHEDHRRSLGTFENADHPVRLAPDSRIAAAAGAPGEHGTKSHHHQGVERVGEGLSVTGWSVMDDLPEVVERDGASWSVGVQWHPEADESSPLIAALIGEARARRAQAVG